jgi:hypothetical protein
MSAKTQRDHREPNSDRGGSQRGGTDLLPHSLTVAPRACGSALYVRIFWYRAAVSLSRELRPETKKRGAEGTRRDPVWTPARSHGGAHASRGAKANARKRLMFPEFQFQFSVRCCFAGDGQSHRHDSYIWPGYRETLRSHS